MRFAAPIAVAIALATALTAQDAAAATKTVCTITVNSPDEREIFRRYLPADQYRFVELVERGRADWLASACRKDVRCDVLVISGHFDGGDVFYTDRFDQNESLPTDELDRVACSESCPGLFSQLKEVYLFGCNTLNAQPTRTASAEIGRSLIRAGHSPAEAAQLARALEARYAESNRDRMRQIFRDVPVIYGFSSKAPLGRNAAPLLERHFQSGSDAEFGSGRASAKLVNLFAPSSMTLASGIAPTDATAPFRDDVCHFADDRLSTANKLDFVHRLLGREIAEVRFALDHIEKYITSISDADRQSPSVARALDSIARDTRARSRFLEFARDADEPSTRARMIELAAHLGWLSPDGLRAEQLQMIHNLIARHEVHASEVSLVCALNRDGALGREPAVKRFPPPSTVGEAAVLACLGDADAHASVVRALTGKHDEDVQIAQVYLRHRPVDATELRTVASAIALMSGADAQVRALDTLAHLRLSDGDILQDLARLFAVAKSVSVQRAIAGILIRADFHALAKPELVRALRQTRIKSPDGEDVIDILIRRLQASI
jgi:hypothetical protein